MSFQLVLKSMTLNGLERRNGRFIALFLLNLVNVRYYNNIWPKLGNPLQNRRFPFNIRS